MNSKQRRKFMTWKHRNLSLGSPVILDGRIPATIFKHDRESPHKCIVRVILSPESERTEWVSLKRVKPTPENKPTVPWFKALKAKRAQEKRR